MSTASGSPESDYHGPVPWPAPPRLPGDRRPWSVGEILAWTAILLLATGAAVLAIFEQRAAAHSADNDPSFTILAKLAVGAGQWSTAGGNQAQFMHNLEQNAQSPEDRLRLAVVAAALEGREKAAPRFEALGAEDPALREDGATARTLCDGGDVPAEVWRNFRAKYGWFADLARAASRPPDDPQRVALFRDASWTMIVLAGATLGVMGLMLLGLALLIVGIVWWSLGKLRLAFQRQDPDAPAGESYPADRRTYVEALAWYLFGMLTFGIALVLVLRWMGYGRDLTVPMEAVALVAAFALGLLWPLIRGQSLARWRAAFGLHRGCGVWREMGCGILGYLAGLPVVGLGLIITSVLVRITGIRATHPISEVLTGSWWWVLVAFILASIWAPLTEELMFRGALFSHLRERFGWWIAAPIVGFIFAIIHPQGWVALPVLGAIGFVFCGIREWRGSIIGCMTAHALHNTAVLIFSLLLLR